MALDPHEVLSITTLFDTGAHTKALALAFGHDQRTIRKAIRRWTRSPLQEPPLFTQWQRGLSSETLAAIQSYLQQLSRHEQQIVQRLCDMAHATEDTLAFTSPHAYGEIIQAAQPRESLIELAQRLHVDLNVVLLAYAEWREQTEYLQWSPVQRGKSRVSKERWGG
jgi:hypothetical protein